MVAISPLFWHIMTVVLSTQIFAMIATLALSPRTPLLVIGDALNSFLKRPDTACPESSKDSDDRPALRSFTCGEVLSDGLGEDENGSNDGEDGEDGEDGMVALYPTVRRLRRRVSWRAGLNP